jgi:hypothetical protein
MNTQSTQSTSLAHTAHVFHLFFFFFFFLDEAETPPPPSASSSRPPSPVSSLPSSPCAFASALLPASCVSGFNAQGSGFGTRDSGRVGGGGLTGWGVCSSGVDFTSFSLNEALLWSKDKPDPEPAPNVCQQRRHDTTQQKEQPPEQDA